MGKAVVSGVAEREVRVVNAASVHSAGVHAGVRADIQGLRALAVLSVVLFHANEQLLPGGFVGVDIFFVISGYLITGILMNEIAAGKFSLAGFYERRVRRLFPALYVMLAVVLAAGAVLLSPHAFSDVGHTALATVFFVSNVDLWQTSGYFDSEVRYQPLLHTWSLAVEEQFYIAFPLFLFVVMRSARKYLRWIIGACALASLALCLKALAHHADAAFYLAPFRAYELLIGAVIAGVTPNLPQRVRDALSLIGLAMIGASFVLIKSHMPFPGFAALLPCVGTALVLFAGAGGTSLGGKLISGAFFGYFGALSYSLYLWHWPVLVFGGHVLFGEQAPWQVALMVLVSIGLAHLSYTYVEQRFMKRRGKPWRAIGAGALAMAMGACAAGAVFVMQGVPQRFDGRALRLFASEESYNHKRSECHNLGNFVRAYADACVFGARGVTPRMAVWGDSHGTELVVALGERLAPRGEAVREMTSSACPPALGYEAFDRPFCAEQNRASLEGLAHDAALRTVVITTNFGAYEEADWPAIFAGYRRGVETLRAAGKEVVLVYPIPVHEYDVPSELGLMAEHGEDPATLVVDRAAHRARFAPVLAFLDALRAETGAHALSAGDALCERTHNHCHAYQPQHGGVMYFDSNHLSIEGARLVAARVPLPPARGQAGAARAKS